MEKKRVEIYHDKQGFRWHRKRVFFRGLYKAYEVRDEPREVNLVMVADTRFVMFLKLKQTEELRGLTAYWCGEGSPYS